MIIQSGQTHVDAFLVSCESSSKSGFISVTAIFNCDSRCSLKNEIYEWILTVSFEKIAVHIDMLM